LAGNLQDALDQYKLQACEYAVQYVESGMVIGLGSGSTAIKALYLIGNMIKSGELEGIQAIPTAETIEHAAREHGIHIAKLNEVIKVDLTIDGADEIDPELNLIKGGGGALLREKIIAQATDREIIVADHTKLSPRLGTRFDLPLEVLPFAWSSHIAFLGGLGGDARRRETESGKPFTSDNGNFILDCAFGPIEDLHDLARTLEQRAGIVEHGLFLNLASEVIVAGPDGIKHIKPE
jgi:ribose 5-phosphate isomerase A